MILWLQPNYFHFTLLHSKYAAVLLPVKAADLKEEVVGRLKYINKHLCAFIYTWVCFWHWLRRGDRSTIC